MIPPTFLLQMKVLAIISLLVAAIVAVKADTIEADAVINLPDGYEWLEIQITVYQNGGDKPEITAEQWLELEELMEELDFTKLSLLLLGDYEDVSYLTTKLLHNSFIIFRRGCTRQFTDNQCN